MKDMDRKLAEAAKLVARSKVSRRDFMQLALAAGLTATAANALFVKAARSEPKKGGHFKIAMGHGATTDSYDPGTWTNGFQFDMAVGVWGAHLTEVDQKNQIKPHLAESFEPADQAKKWVFKLRKGLTFHDGKTITADDVVASYNYHRGADSKSAAKSNLDIVEELKADGPETVVFSLKSGSADFPYVTSDYHLPIYPSKDGVADWSKAVSAGPFILENYEPGVRLTAKRNPNYFKSEGPNFDSVELLTIADVTARTNGLNTGELHYIDRIDLTTIDLLKRNPQLDITDVSGFGHYVAPMNVTVPPFDNVDVRTALKWAIDREDLVRKILHGYGKAGNDNPIASSIKFATNPEPVYTYDPEKAKFHLKKAGIETLKIDFSVSNAAFASAVDAGVLMQESAKAANIDINLIREPDDSYWDNVWMKKPWCMSYWGGRPTCDWMFTTAYAADAAWNDTFWKNARFNELLAAARAETDEAKRAAMYAEMQQILHDDGGIIVLMFNNFVSAFSKTVAHGDLNSNFDHDGGYIYERWWFA